MLAVRCSKVSICINRQQHRRRCPHRPRIFHPQRRPRSLTSRQPVKIHRHRPVPCLNGQQLAVTRNKYRRQQSPPMRKRRPFKRLSRRQVRHRLKRRKAPSNPQHKTPMPQTPQIPRVVMQMPLRLGNHLPRRQLNQLGRHHAIFIIHRIAIQPWHQPTLAIGKQQVVAIDEVHAQHRSAARQKALRNPRKSKVLQQQPRLRSRLLGPRKRRPRNNRRKRKRKPTAPNDNRALTACFLSLCLHNQTPQPRVHVLFHRRAVFCQFARPSPAPPFAPRRVSKNSAVGASYA